MRTTGTPHKCGDNVVVESKDPVGGYPQGPELHSKFQIRTWSHTTNLDALPAFDLAFHLAVSLKFCFHIAFYCHISNIYFNRFHSIKSPFFRILVRITLFRFMIFNWSWSCCGQVFDNFAASLWSWSLPAPIPLFRYSLPRRRWIAKGWLCMDVSVWSISSSWFKFRIRAA